VTLPRPILKEHRATCKDFVVCPSCNTTEPRCDCLFKCLRCAHFATREKKNLCSYCFKEQSGLPLPSSDDDYIAPLDIAKYMDRYTLSKPQEALVQRWVDSIKKSGKVPTPCDIFLGLLNCGCRIGERGISWETAQIVKSIDPKYGKPEGWNYQHAICPLIVDFWNITWGIGHCYYAMDRPHPLARGKKHTEARFEEAPSFHADVGDERSDKPQTNPFLENAKKSSALKERSFFRCVRALRDAGMAAEVEENYAELCYLYYYK